MQTLAQDLTGYPFKHHLYTQQIKAWLFSKKKKKDLEPSPQGALCKHNHGWNRGRYVA